MNRNWPEPGSTCSQLVFAIVVLCSVTYDVMPGQMSSFRSLRSM
jgi:hypothetical protein